MPLHFTKSLITLIILITNLEYPIIERQIQSDTFWLALYIENMFTFIFSAGEHGLFGILYSHI